MVVVGAVVEVLTGAFSSLEVLVRRRRRLKGQIAMLAGTGTGHPFESAVVPCVKLVTTEAVMMDRTIGCGWSAAAKTARVSGLWRFQPFGGLEWLEAVYARGTIVDQSRACAIGWRRGDDQIAASV